MQPWECNPGDANPGDANPGDAMDSSGFKAGSERERAVGNGGVTWDSCGKVRCSIINQGQSGSRMNIFNSK
jgi:hypothetical protein